MKKIWLFCMFGFICGAAVLITTEDLFSQRGMKITVRTEAGQDIPLYNNSYALVIGNGTYTNGWDPLKGALKDVQEVATALEKHGFDVTLKTDLGKMEFENAFETFIRNGRRDENSRLLFYYAGHGYTETLRTGAQLGYLVMIDSPLPTTAGAIDGSKNIDMESLVTQAKRIDARHVLYVLDSCFSGSILNARNVPKPPVIRDSIKHPVRQFITAGRAEQPVPDHSVFKTAFLDILEGRAEELIRDGYITGEELGLYLRNAVSTYNPAQTPQYGKINDPSLDKGDFVFVLENLVAPGTVESLSTTATLKVTSTPRGATVYVDGNPVGSTPLSEYQMDTGVRREKQIEVGVELSGYKSQVVRLTLKGGHTTPWDVRLEKVTSTQTRPTKKPTPPAGDAPKGMVLIPAGEFQMGSNNGRDDEKPVHTVYVDAFYMDKYEVTVGQYKTFVRSTGHRSPDWRGVAKYSPTDRHPMTYVRWYDAMAYAKWVGKRLPTEAEWEYAARGGLVGKRYPRGNTRNASNVGKTSPVGSYVANGYGLYDMAGNVWEWCLDAYDENFYKNSPRKNPLSGANSIQWLLDNYTGINISHRVVRGGSWLTPDTFRRVAYRGSDTPANWHSGLGFRCVRAVE